MKPKEKEYHEEVIIPKVWEQIPYFDKEANKDSFTHHLITIPISEYIHDLEDKVKKYEEKLIKLGHGNSI